MRSPARFDPSTHSTTVVSRPDLERVERALAGLQQTVATLGQTMKELDAAVRRDTLAVTGAACLRGIVELRQDMQTLAAMLRKELRLMGQREDRREKLAARKAAVAKPNARDEGLAGMARPSVSGR